MTKVVCRWNVTDHGKLRAIRIDTKGLGDYPGIPLWDAIDHRIPNVSDDE